MNRYSDFIYAVPLALFLAFIYITLQKLGLINMFGITSVSLSSAFLIGIIASLSSCMAVVGGLVLSVSATLAKSNKSYWPHLVFHASRLIAFFILGGAIGVIGKAFTLNTFSSVVMSLVIAVIMFIVGLNLIDIFPWAEKLVPRLPSSFSVYAESMSKWRSYIAPILLGVVTFFLPCGFTQSMQVNALGSGSFLGGGLMMLSFALGTLPVLLIVSFSSFSVKDGRASSIFFKTSGLIVIMFALLNVVTALIVAGVVPPVFNI